MKKIIESYFYVSHKPFRSKRTNNPGSSAVWRGIQKAMKITTAIILVAALHVSASGVAQKISFAGENVPLNKVFNAIEDQLGFGVLMPHKLMEGAKPVTVKIEGGTLDELLQKCFAFQPWKLQYTITGRTILISRDESISSQVGPTIDIAKTVKITGTVYNDSGEPLEGASVTIKASGKAVLTNAKGEFLFSSVPQNSILTISFIGYSPQDIKASESQEIKIHLKATRDELDKVVIQAYGTTTQRLTTGNIATVSAEQIEKQPVMNPLLSLQGQVPGVVVTPVTGYTSGPITVDIRGRNFISPSITTDPLYIVDGVPLSVVEISNSSSYTGGSAGFIQNGIQNPANGQSPLFSLNPLDIESIEILKDADATAIYGSQAANGVIIITTKKGKPGKTHLDVNVSQGERFVTRQWNMLNTSQYLEMRREAFSNSGQPINVSTAPDLLVWGTTRYTNWQKYLWGNTGRWIDAHLGVSGGDAQTTFRISAGYNRSTEITTVSGANQRASLSFSFGHSSLDHRFNLSFTTDYSFAEVNIIAMPGGATLPPDAPPVFDKFGNLNYAAWDQTGTGFPFAALLQPYDSKTNFLTTNLALHYNLLKGLVLKASFGYNNAQVNQTNFTPITSQDTYQNPGATGVAIFGNNRNNNWIIEPQAEYNTFVGKGKLNILIGGTDKSTTTDGSAQAGLGYTDDALLRTISNAARVFGQDNHGQYKYSAVFGRIGYNWENKYILNLNARRDGSSNFGPGDQFGNFGSIGVAWILSEEKWMERLLPSFFSFVKLRGSYGIAGGNAGSAYAYLSQWSSNSIGTYNGVSPLAPLQAVNPDYHWAVNHKSEGALDLGLLKDRVNVEAAYYRNRCDNQLVAFPTPVLTGFPYVPEANSPANVENSGWEFLMNAKIINSKNFTWSMNFNIAFNRNKLLGYPNLSQSPYATNYIIGQPLDLTYQLHCTGVDPQTGQYTFEDKNHDGAITLNYSASPPGSGNDDRYSFNLDPKFTGGFGTSLSYKSWSLGVSGYFKKQIAQNALVGSYPGLMANISTYAFNNHWQKPRDISNIARFTTTPVNSDSYFTSSDGLYTDASFIRLSNISLSYSLPAQMARKAGMTNLSLNIYTNNILTITKYKGLDPEVTGFGGMPPSRVIIGGIRCSF